MSDKKYDEAKLSEMGITLPFGASKINFESH
jgi:hypothetical protein